MKQDRLQVKEWAVLVGSWIVAAFAFGGIAKVWL